MKKAILYISLSIAMILLDRYVITVLPNQSSNLGAILGALLGELFVLSAVALIPVFIISSFKKGYLSWESFGLVLLIITFLSEVEQLYLI